MMKILYCVAGVGFGNIARALAVLPYLEGCDVHLAGPPKVCRRLEKIRPCSILSPVDYPAGSGLHFRSIASIMPVLIRALRSNINVYKTLIENLSPDIVVADSDFYILWPAQRAGIPIVSINQSPATVAFYKSHTLSRKHAASYFVLERLDQILSERFASRILVPTFPNDPVVRERKMRPISLVSRFEGPLPPRPASGKAVVLLGGSEVRPDLDLSVLGDDVHVLGVEGASSATIRYHGFVEDVDAHLLDAEVVVAAGGLSTLGDLIRLQRPALVVPLQGHAEQWANARRFEACGFGIHSSSKSLRRDLSRYREHRDSFCEAMAACAVDGARQIAEEILRL